MSEQQAPDPNTGAGQEDKGPSVEQRLAQLEKTATEATERAERERQGREKAEGESRRLQASRDRVQAERDKLQQARAAGGGRDAANELQDFANKKAKEAALYKALSAAGLKEGELPEDFDFETPSELRLALQAIQLEKTVKEQGRRLSEREEREKKAAEEAAAATAAAAKLHEQEASRQRRIDTGGPSGRGPKERPSPNDPVKMRERAVELRAKGDPKSLQEARWLVLNAAHRDPNNIIGRGTGGETEEG